jgi:heptosyltransferase-3
MGNTFKRIIISRTDAIGDVILTFPLCGVIKKKFPQSQLIFLGRTYTQPLVRCCEHVDEFLNADDLLKQSKKDAVNMLKNINADVIIHVFPDIQIARLAKDVGIPLRIGTTNRLFHWGTVNELIYLSRKNSSLHESQLNCKLLKPLGINVVPDLVDVKNYIGFTRTPQLEAENLSILDKDKTNIILHPKSNTSAREWSLNNYESLINILSPDRYKIFISGTDREKVSLAAWIKSLPPHVVDITGRFSLDEFIAFISQVDGLVAASTGPLHIAASLGITAIGIFPPIKPMHPGRWQPIGKKASYLCSEKSCNDCRDDALRCHCINEITPMKVLEKLEAKD